MKKHGLGRGLDQLLGASDSAAASSGEGIRRIAVADLRPGAGQPRRKFAPEELQTLADSVRKSGVMQPIIARPIKSGGGGLEIVAGERRWRAAQMARLADIPVIVRELSDRDAMLFALVENIQRADLNAAEQARGISRFIAETQMTHAQAAEQLGMSRAAVSNLLRLLSLSPPVLKMLEDGALDGGHARALLPLSPPRQLALARKVANEKLSVRDAEKFARKFGTDSDSDPQLRNATTGSAFNSGATKDGDTRRLESELSEKLSTRVQILSRGKGGKSGKLVLHYASLESLDRILRRLQKP